MAGDEAVEVVALQAEAGEIVPASHVFSRSGQAGNLAKDLEQTIVIEVEKAGVVLFVLAVHGTVEQLHLRIGKGGERSVDGDRTSACGGRICGSRDCVGPGGKHASSVSGCGGSGGGLEKSSAADTAGHRCLLGNGVLAANVYQSASPSCLIFVNCLPRHLRSEASVADLAAHVSESPLSRSARNLTEVRDRPAFPET